MPEQESPEQKIEVKTSQGTRINSPSTFPISKEWHSRLDQIAALTEDVFGREVFALYLNPDRENPGALHDVKIIFRKKL